jgi:hypothetical protein
MVFFAGTPTSVCPTVHVAADGTFSCHTYPLRAGQQTFNVNYYPTNAFRVARTTAPTVTIH